MDRAALNRLVSPHSAPTPLREFCAVTPPDQTEIQIFTLACGFLASATFMRFVVKAPARRPRDPRRDGDGRSQR
jgi:hypothetical protein